MKLKLPTHFHFPHFDLAVPRKKVGRWMMRYGAYGMLFDGIVKIGAIALGFELAHHIEGLASVFGANGAAVAGLGALIDIAEDA